MLCPEEPPVARAEWPLSDARLFYDEGKWALVLEYPGRQERGTKSRGTQYGHEFRYGTPGKVVGGQKDT